MEDKPVEITTFQGPLVIGNFRSVDFDILNFHFHLLETPIGCIPEAVIRASDIIKISFKATGI